MAVLQFKFDESYDSQIMSVGGWIGNELEWERLESRWQRRIDHENAKAKLNQKITRFHATEINGLKGEFQNWDQDMSGQFCKKLIGLLSKRKIGALAVACDMNAIREVFPNGNQDALKANTYSLCIKTLIIEIAHILREIFPYDTVLLVHDHGSWDLVALNAYNKMLEERELNIGHLFEGLLPKTGKQCVGLQAADLFAYEVFKGVKKKTNSPEAEMRKASQAMLHKGIPMMAKWIDLASAKALHQIMKDTGKYPNIDTQGIY